VKKKGKKKGKKKTKDEAEIFEPNQKCKNDEVPDSSFLLLLLESRIGLGFGKERYKVVTPTQSQTFFKTYVPTTAMRRYSTNNKVDDSCHSNCLLRRGDRNPE
jgi:hypothetical protein